MTCKRCSHWLPQPLSCASSSSSELMLEYSWKSFQTVHFPTAPTLGEHIPKRWKKTQSHSCPMANDLYSEKLSWNLKHIFVYDDFILIIYMISTWNLLFFGYSIFQFSFLLVFRGHSPPRLRVALGVAGLEALKTCGSFQVVEGLPKQSASYWSPLF